jgi:phasin family protein
MSPQNLEQVAAEQQDNLDLVFGVASKIAESMEKLANLNLDVAKAALAEAQETALKACSATGPQDWIALQASAAAPTAEKMQSYSRQVYDLFAATQAEIARLAETRYEAYNRRLQSLVEDVAKSAPAGSEAAVAAWKSALNATNTLFETLQKTSRQAMQVAESNLEAVTTVASKTARRAAEQASSTTGTQR